MNYFTSNANGEAEIIKVVLKPNPRLKKVFFDYDFSQLAIKGRASMGNLLSKNDIARILLKSQGGSTLGGRKVWYDKDVNRLNYDEQGVCLGEFQSDDQILVIRATGEYYLTGFDLNVHFEDDVLRIEKYDEGKVWTAVLIDEDQNGFCYIKRFALEAAKKKQTFMGENPDNRLLLLTDTPYARLKVIMGAPDDFREPIELEAESFITVKSTKAKGKRITTFRVERVEELEPLRVPEAPQQSEFRAEDDGEAGTVDNMESQEDVRDQLNGQMHLDFD